MISVSIPGGAEEKCIGSLMTDQFTFNRQNSGRDGWGFLWTLVQLCIFN